MLFAEKFVMEYKKNQKQNIYRYAKKLESKKTKPATILQSL